MKMAYKDLEMPRTGCGHQPIRRTSRREKPNLGHIGTRRGGRRRRPAGAVIKKAGSNGAGLAEHDLFGSLPLDCCIARFDVVNRAVELVFPPLSRRENHIVTP